MRDQRFLGAFAFLWSLFAMGYFSAITFIPMPATATRFADTILGFLIGTAVAGILGWAFDGSYTQTKKDAVALEPPEPTEAK